MISISKSKLAFVSLLLPLLAFSNEGKLKEEKELELINFNNIKKVLEEDGLSQEALNKKKAVEKIKVEKAKISAQRSLYPSEEEMWGFLTEYFLVKNAQLLNWDYQKPDYGFEVTFKELLEKLGFYQKRARVLVLNTPNTHRGVLPGTNGQDTYLISLPFIRSMDLSKLEISLLLLEDFFRSDSGQIRARLKTESFSKIVGSSMNGKVDKEFLKEMNDKYQSSLSTGYSFQQQFEITKKMDTYLKPHTDLWNTYYRLLIKLNDFTKSNSLYKNYINIYPSPEMQIKWLSPEKKVL